MSNSINRVFNPFKQTLAADERLRLQDGVLTVENLSVRSSARSWIWLFFTRGQYSQKAILENMANLYKEAIDKQNEDKYHLTNTFHDNYKTLIGRASKQNDKFANINCITRFFIAKSFIELKSHQDKLSKIKALLPTIFKNDNSNPDSRTSQKSDHSSSESSSNSQKDILNDNSNSNLSESTIIEENGINPDLLKSTIFEISNSNSNLSESTIILIEENDSNPDLFKSTIFGNDNSNSNLLESTNPDLLKSTIFEISNSNSNLSESTIILIEENDSNPDLFKSTIFGNDNSNSNLLESTNPDLLKSSISEKGVNTKSNKIKFTHKRNPGKNSVKDTTQVSDPVTKLEKLKKSLVRLEEQKHRKILVNLKKIKHLKAQIKTLGKTIANTKS